MSLRSTLDPRIILACYSKGVQSHPRLAKRLKSAAQLVLNNKVRWMDEAIYEVQSRSTNQVWMVDLAEDYPCCCPDSNPNNPKHNMHTSAPKHEAKGYGFCAHILAAYIVERAYLFDERIESARFFHQQAIERVKEAEAAAARAEEEYYKQKRKLYDFIDEGQAVLDNEVWAQELLSPVYEEEH